MGEAVNLGDAGSVLIEALVSTTIATAAVAALMLAAKTSARQQNQVEDRRLALLVAESRLASVGLDLSAAAGQTLGQDGRFAWRVAVEPNGAAEDGRVGAPVLVIVTVGLASGGGDLVSLSSLRLP